MKNIIKKIISPRNLGAVIAIVLVTGATALAAIPAYKSWLQQGTSVYTMGTNVGIGTTNPVAKLDIAGDSTGPLLIVGDNTPDANAQIWFGGDNSGERIQRDNEYNTLGFPDLIFRTGAGAPPRLIIKNEGNVGIGTTNPGNKLDVAGDQGAILSRQTAGGGYTFIGFNDAGQYGRIGAYNGGWKNMVIAEGGGNVGIGTVNPQTPLEVRNNGQFTGIVGHASSGYGCGGTSGGGIGTCGVVGISDHIYGTGVFGEARDMTGGGVTFGVFGRTFAPYSAGVYGHDLASNSSSGVQGVSLSTGGIGVYGYGNFGVRGNSSGGPGSYGVISFGNLAVVGGTKSFIQPHPTDASKEIHFVSLEGNESGTYFRGTAKLVNGQTVVVVPEEFRLVTEPEGLTVQVTPRGKAQVWVEVVTLEQIVIEGDTDVEVNYFVNGIRRGYAEFVAIKENNVYRPEYRGLPYGTQYPDAFRQILVQNKILNPDFIPNEQTAATLGWTLKDAKDAPERSRETLAKPVE